MTPPRLRRWMAAAFGAVALLVWAGVALDGRAPTARQRFESARTAEARARAAALLVADGASDAVQDRVLSQGRRVAVQYEALVRRFPTSSYCDDALFQAGTLLQWLHGRFGRDADRVSAARYLTWLTREYPASRHVRQARVAARALETPAPSAAAPPARTAAAASAKPAPATATPSPVAPVGTSAPSPGSPANTPVSRAAVPASPAGPPTLRDISRTVLDDTVRITLALDREAPFTHETLAGPPRAFVDLFGAATSDALQDAAVRFDADAVRQVRVGRRPGAVRVVLDLSETTRVSVYSLYNPFRVVIDADRTTAGRLPVSPTLATPPARAAAPTPEAGGSASVAAAAPVRPEAPLPGAPPASTRAGSPTRPPVAAPEPLPPPVVMPAEAPVVLTVEAGALPSGDAPSTEASPGGNASSDVPALLEPAPTPAAPTAPTAAPPAGAAPIAVTAASTPPAPAVAIPSSIPAAAGAASAPSPPPAAPSANTDGSFSLARQLGLGVSRIVIDPGHGGRDPGTLAHGSSEAKLVLDVALRLERLLEREGFEVVLTRRTDVYIPLEERTAIANRERADLFLSIHANASRNPQARGIETYYLSFASNPEAETVAARENATSAGGMHNLTSIVRAIALNNKLDESRDLAGMVQRALAAQLSKGAAGSRSRGVKKAPFVVLIGAGMPSVLAEIGFITNRTEAGLIKTPGYRQRIAESLRDAVVQYQRSLKRATAVATTGR